MGLDGANFIVAFKAVVPVFVLIGIGLVIQRQKLLTEAELRRVNRMVFQIFFFVMMFYNLYTTNLGETFRPRLVVFALTALAVVYGAAFALVYRGERSNRRRGAMIQAIYRSNFVLMGVPLVGNMFGEANIAVTTMMIAIVVPIYNVLGVITLEIFRGGTCSVKKLFAGLLKNPMIRGALLGLFCLLLKVPVPEPVLRPLSQVAAATTPLALIILGASFHAGSTSEHRPQLAVCIVSRLLLVPGAVLTAAALLGFRGIEFATLLSIFATPCAVAGFAMAQQMESDADLAGNAVVFTTALSSLTIFGWILLAKTLGIF